MQTIDRARTAAISLLVILLTATTACQNTRVKTAEYEVLSSFIDAKFASRKGIEPLAPTGDGISKIVIGNLSEPNKQAFGWQVDANGHPIPWKQIASSLQSRAPALQRATLDSFHEVNKQPSTFERSFHLAIDYELVDAMQLKPLFKNGGWPAYYKRFPGSPGMLGFSRIGFSADGQQAFFYATNNCDVLCGGGEYVVMDRLGGRWVIEKEIETWMS
jgi:hypothetical protein